MNNKFTAEGVFYRFFQQVMILSINECWNATGYLDKDGYKQFRDELGKRRRMHAWAYETFRKDKIPSGFCIDHLCKNRKCQNPWHMEVVTISENVKRGDSPAMLQAKATHCPRGHLYTEQRQKNGSRCCWECVKIRGRNYKRTVTPT